MMDPMPPKTAFDGMIPSALKDKYQKVTLNAHREGIRTFIVDSGASDHLISWKYMTPKEKRKARRLDKPKKYASANGIVRGTHIGWIWIRDLSKKLQVTILKSDCPPLISMGMLCLKDN